MPQCVSCGGNYFNTEPRCPFCQTENPTYQTATGTFDSLLNAGRAAMQSGDFTTAADFFRQALTAAPDAFDVYFYLAHCLTELKQYSESAQWMEKALTFDPEHPSILYNLGITLKYSGHSDKARQYFEQAQTVLQKYPERYNTDYLGPALDKELN